MIEPTNITVPTDLIKNASSFICKMNDVKTSLNQPTGNFFYDKWIIKEEFKNTVWESILDFFPEDIGEARIINLTSGSCYLQHADIDDRYHLNIIGENSYFIDVDNQNIHKIKNDGIIYEMDTGRIHSAINLDCDDRYQLVVRKRLAQSHLVNYSTVVIRPIHEKARFIFDNKISPLLNKFNKLNALANFEIISDGVSFDLQKDNLHEFDNLDPTEFNLTAT